MRIREAEGGRGEAVRLVVNGEPRELAAEISVAGLLQFLSIPQGPVAVEVNLEIVPRSLHESHVLSEGDRIEIVTMVGGG